MPITAVLFDVGGPINREIEHERGIDADILAGLAEAGVAVSATEYAGAWRRAVDSFASNAYRAVIWQLSGRNPALAASINEMVAARSRARAAFELRAGIAELLRELHARGLLLGLAANQPLMALERLDAAGVGRCFHYREVSGSHGLFKPDPRLFLRACEGLRVKPEQCIMVGDRIDNDVVPARLLGMRTVLFRTGRHAGQQPRSWDEIPDREVLDVEGLHAALEELIGSS